MTWISGFCSGGAHEGMKPRSFTGKPMKTCGRIAEKATLERDAKGKLTGERADLVCACSCHETLDKLFEMSGMERVIQDNPEYHPEKSTYWMPSIEDRVASFIAASSVPARREESVAPDLVPATIVREYAPTKSGRSARGELESYVKRVCDTWLVEDELQNGVGCTPAYIAREAAKLMGIAKEPSQGAVNAVLERWVALGFAIVAKKPTRFTGYTQQGIALGLEAMKIQAKVRRANGHTRR